MVPPAKRTSCVRFAEFICYTAWEEDLKHQLRHGLIFERCEVDVVNLGDVGDQCGEDYESHYDLKYEKLFGLGCSW